MLVTTNTVLVLTKISKLTVDNAYYLINFQESHPGLVSLPSENKYNEETRYIFHHQVIYFLTIQLFIL